MNGGGGASVLLAGLMLLAPGQVFGQPRRGEMNYEQFALKLIGDYCLPDTPPDVDPVFILQQQIAILAGFAGSANELFLAAIGEAGQARAEISTKQGLLDDLKRNQSTEPENEAQLLARKTVLEASLAPLRGIETRIATHEQQYAALPALTADGTPDYRREFHRTQLEIARRERSQMMANPNISRMINELEGIDRDIESSRANRLGADSYLRIAALERDIKAAKERQNRAEARANAEAEIYLSYRTLIVVMEKVVEVVRQCTTNRQGGPGSQVPAVTGPSSDPRIRGTYQGTCGDVRLSGTFSMSLSPTGSVIGATEDQSISGSWIPRNGRIGGTSSGGWIWEGVVQQAGAQWSGRGTARMPGPGSGNCTLEWTGR